MYTRAPVHLPISPLSVVCQLKAHELALFLTEGSVDFEKLHGLEAKQQLTCLKET